MKIRMLNSVAGSDENGPYSYGKGDHDSIPIERAKMLVKAGHAISLDTDARENATDKKAKAEKR